MSLSDNVQQLHELIREVIEIRASFGFTGPAERYRIRVLCAQKFAQCH